MTDTDLGIVTGLSVTGPGAFSFDEFRTGLTFDSVVPQLQFKHGDANLDNQVSQDDVQGLMVALSDLNTYRSQRNINTSQFLTTSDIDGDGKVTNADVNALIGLLRTGGASIATVPEPGALVLSAIGILIVIIQATCSDNMGRLLIWMRRVRL